MYPVGVKVASTKTRKIKVGGWWLYPTSAVTFMGTRNTHCSIFFFFFFLLVVLSFFSESTLKRNRMEKYINLAEQLNFTTYVEDGPNTKPRCS